MKRFESEELKRSTRVHFAHRVEVKFQDVDAAGIVYFARVFDYVHAAYEALLADVGLPLARVLAEKKWAAPLRHAELTYKSPLRFGDGATVKLVALSPEATEVSLGYRLENDAGRLVATGTTVHTFIDPSTFERTNVPEALRAKIDEFLTAV